MSDVKVKYAPEFVLFEFDCGHVGRDNESPKAKAHGFIRMAELRMMPVMRVAKPCPECKR